MPGFHPVAEAPTMPRFHSVADAPTRPRLHAVAEATLPRLHAVDPVDELCVRKAEVCASAVDALEIAAALEADGLGDQQVRRRYGRPDVFALAEEMFARVPRSPAEPAAVPDPWQIRPAEHVLHGLLYTLPGLGFAAVAELMAGRSAHLVLAVTMLASWAASQGLAYLGYARLGRLDAAGAARVLRIGLPVCATVFLVGAAGAVAASLPVGGVLVATAQAEYLLGATVLMVTRSERLLLVALAPGTVAGAVYLALGEPAVLRPYTWGALATTAVLAVVLGAWMTRHPDRASGPVVTRSEAGGAVRFAIFGLVAAGLLVFPIVAGDVVPGPGDAGPMLAMLPLSLSMGAAEWVLHSYRRRMHRLLRESRSLGWFARGSHTVLLTSLLAYAAVTAVLIGIAVTVGSVTGLVHPQWTTLLECLAYLVLGAALFVALILQALRAGGAVVLVACAAALAMEFALSAFSHGRPTELAAAQLLAASLLLCALTTCAVVALSQAVRHQ